MDLIIKTFGLAVVDAINPSILVATIILLMSKNPLPRTVAYFVAIYLANLIIGITVLVGLGDYVSTWVQWIIGSKDWWRYVIQGAIALGLLYAVVKTDAEKPINVSRAPKADMGVLAAFGFGFVVTLVEMSTAAFYFSALALMAQANLSTTQELGYLAGYCAVYLWTALSLLGTYLLWRAKGKEDRLQLVRPKIERIVKQTLKVVGVAIALLLLTNLALL